MPDEKRIPLVPAALPAPVKAATIGGDLFAWDEAKDPPWDGTWAFPANGWSDAQREAWVGTQGHLIAVTRAHEATLAAGDAYAQSADFLLAQADAEVAEKIRAREIDQRRIDGAKAWTEAGKRYGRHNIRAIPTVEGDVVIMVGMTAKEGDAANAAAQQAYDLQMKNDPSAKALATSDYIGVQRDWMLGKCVWPDKDRIRAIAETRFSLWAELSAARDDMARARIDDEGKGFALS